MATLVNKRNREVKVIIPNMRESQTFYSDNDGAIGIFFKRDWEEKSTNQEDYWKPAEPRKRNKPKESWLSKAKYEIEHADELLRQSQEELKEIRELKKQEQKPICDIASDDAIESCMLRYLQSAANRKDDIEIIEDTKAYKSELISIIKKEQKPKDITLSREDCLHQLFENGTITMADYLYLTTNRRKQKPAEKHDLVAQLKEHLANTPKKQLEAEWKELEKWNHIGPTAEEYLRSIKPVEKSLEDDHIIGFVYDLLNEIEWKDSWAMSKEECLRLLSNYIPQKSAEKQDYSGLNDLERAILRGFLAAGIENVPVTIIKETAKECLAQMKPAKWGENDENMLNSIINVVCGVGIQSNGGLREKQVSWLKSIPERFNLQPKEEWSDEDEKMLTELLLTIEPSNNYDEMRNWLLLKLKALLLQGSKDSLQTSWKPSEEQIKALERTVRLANFGLEENRRKTLIFLYEQLKKL